MPNTLRLKTESGKTYYVHLFIGIYPQGQNIGVSNVGGSPIVYSEPKVDYTKQLILEDEEVALKRLQL